MRRFRLALAAVTSALVIGTGGAAAQAAGEWSDAPTAEVTGRVIAPSGAGVSGMCVRLIEPSPWTEIFTQRTCDDAAVTDSSGRYTITPDPWLEGQRWAVMTWDPRGRFSGRLSGNTRDPARASAFLVQGEVAVTDIAVLRGAVVSGSTVTTSGVGVSGICPGAYLSSTYVWGTTQICSDTSGQYSLRALPPATVTLRLDGDIAAGFPVRWYDNATTQVAATPIAVAAGQQVALHPQVYELPGTVSGRVTNQSGTPMAGALVDFSGQFSALLGSCDGPLCATTDARGQYSIVLPPGTYTPLVSDVRDRFAAVFSGNSALRIHATPVTVTTEQASVQDFSVRSGSRIAGTFSDASMRPTIARVLSARNDTVGIIDIGADGAMRSSRLLPGRYKVAIEGSGLFYPSFSTAWGDGLWVTVRAGQPTIIVWPQMPL